MDFLRGKKRKQALIGVKGFVASWDFWGHIAAMRLLQDEIDRQAKEWKEKGILPNHETNRLFNAWTYLNTVGAAREAMQTNFK
jgi:hypothetical protein